MAVLFSVFTVSSSSLHKTQVSYDKVIIKYSRLGASKSSDIYRGLLFLHIFSGHTVWSIGETWLLGSGFNTETTQWPLSCPTVFQSILALCSSHLLLLSLAIQKKNKKIIKLIIWPERSLVRGSSGSDAMRNNRKHSPLRTPPIMSANTLARETGLYDDSTSSKWFFFPPRFHHIWYHIRASAGMTSPCAEPCGSRHERRGACFMVWFTLGQMACIVEDGNWLVSM